MSYIYLLEEGEAFTAESYSDILQSVQLKSNPKTEKFYCNDSETDGFPNSQFGMMCEPLTENLGEDKSKLSAVDSHAKTLARQGRELELVESVADYGESLLGLLAKYDPSTHLLKTVQCSLLEDLTGCSPILPRWGTMPNGAVYQRPIVELGMRETEFGYLLPTVNTTGLDGGSNSRKANKKRMFPTPTCHLMKETNAPSEARRNEPSLASYLGGKPTAEFIEWMQGWPTGSTAFSPSGMDKFHEWRQQHSVC